MDPKFLSGLGKIGIMHTGIGIICVGGTSGLDVNLDYTCPD